MKKVLLSVILVLLCSLLLAACGKGEEAPEGLSVIEINEEHGFKFYGPEGWMVINSKVDTDSEIWGAKMSSVNNISLTLAKADMPKEDINAYFEKSLTEFPENMKPFVVTAPTLSNFGNADEAYRCVYTYKYEANGKSYDFACMQYFIKNDGDFYIFTYTSYGDVNDEGSDFNLYYDKIELSIKSFLFTDKGNTSEEKKEYITDADGYKLVSDKRLTGYELYLPAESEVIISDGYVNAKLSEAANITLIKAQQTSVGIIDYLENRKAELEGLFGDVRDIRIELGTMPERSEDELREIFSAFDVDLPEINEELCFGDLKKSSLVLYEYSYSAGGVSYHVIQVLGIDLSNGYVLTYTATEEEYGKHLEALDKILEKVKF